MRGFEYLELPEEVLPCAFLVVGVTLLSITVSANAQTTPFDGLWQLTLTCPATSKGGGAKGYIRSSFRPTSRKVN